GCGPRCLAFTVRLTSAVMSCGLRTLTPGPDGVWPTPEMSVPYGVLSWKSSGTRCVPHGNETFPGTQRLLLAAPLDDRAVHAQRPQTPSPPFLAAVACGVLEPQPSTQHPLPADGSHPVRSVRQIQSSMLETSQ